MAIDPGLDRKFQEFLEKYGVFDKLMAELTKNDLSLEKLKFQRKEMLLLPLLFELAAESGEDIPEERRSELVLPEFDPEKKLSEDVMGQMGVFILKSVEILGDEKMRLVLESSVKNVGASLLASYQSSKK